MSLEELREVQELGEEYEDDDWGHPGNPYYYGHS